MALKDITQADLKGKRVIARFDFNVPLDKKDRSKITDTTRVPLRAKKKIAIAIFLKWPPKQSLEVLPFGRG